MHVVLSYEDVRPLVTHMQRPFITIFLFVVDFRDLYFMFIENYSVGEWQNKIQHSLHRSAFFRLDKLHRLFWTPNVSLNFALGIMSRKKILISYTTVTETQQIGLPGSASLTGFVVRQNPPPDSAAILICIGLSRRIGAVRAELRGLHWQTKNYLFQNALEFFKYFGAKWCPKHDVAFSFTLN